MATAFVQKAAYGLWGLGQPAWWKLAGEFYGLKCSLFGMHDCLINTYREGRQRQGFEKQQLAVEQM